GRDHAGAAADRASNLRPHNENRNRLGHAMTSTASMDAASGVRTRVAPMTRIALTTLMLLPAVSLLGQSSQRPAKHQGLAVDFAKVKWTNVSPTDSTVQYSMLHVDSISGATQMLWRFPANAKGPCEWHGAGQGTAVIQGSIVVRHAGTAGTRLGVGGF